MTYSDYRHLRFERPESGVLQITIDRPERMNATDERLHRELTTVLRDVAEDHRTLVALITGAGRAFASASITTKARAKTAVTARTMRG